MPAPHNSADSPVMQQYLGIKQRYPDAVLMFRMGDFYEMFFEDAVTVAPILDIAVTSRDKNAQDPVPMAGVPYHAIGGYLRTLVEQGVKVAICEQLESPAEAKKRKGKAKIVHRDVVRVVTPGALVDAEHLQGGESNYFAVLVPADTQKDAQRLAFCVLDISCGDFQVQHLEDLSQLRAQLARLGPRELLAPSSMHDKLRELLRPMQLPLVDLSHPPSPAHAKRVGHLLGQSHPQSAPSPSLVQAAAHALAYAEHTQPGQALLIHRLRCHKSHEHLHLDESSLRNLEVFATIREGQRKGTLRWAIDRTRTAMGARCLHAWLGAPLRDRAAIEARQDAVSFLLEDAALRSSLQTALKEQRDIVRLAARAKLSSISPRELGALRDTLRALPDLVADLSKALAAHKDAPLVQLLDFGSDLCQTLAKELCRSLVATPPSHTRDGGMIAEGTCKKLDKQRALKDGGQQELSDIETKERESTGIANLKVQHNRVFGYFFEVPKRELAKVPSHYVRKQTTANAERYVTPTLAQLESKVLAAQELALAREQEIFKELVQATAEQSERLYELGECVARLDVLCGFAQLAQTQNYCRPTWSKQAQIEICEGRHPVLEQLLDHGAFVPNDVALAAAGEPGRLWVLTGPNMGGKSTVMRQVGLCVILAQIGCFVPATSAHLGIFDRVFTRVGAADDLGRGESTFMVEMRETAAILRHASPKSLVLLDEIGRGTATFDGLSIAWAVTEYLHDQVQCQTMFATHYHELCGLAQRLGYVKNMHVAVHQERGEIRFLHRVEKGPAHKSYGIAVGRLAGLPSSVLRRASKILARLEGQSLTGPRDQLDLFAPRASGDQAEPSGEGPGVIPSSIQDKTLEQAQSLLERLQALDLDDMSPKQAHATLDRWRQELA